MPSWPADSPLTILGPDLLILKKANRVSETRVVDCSRKLVFTRNYLGFRFLIFGLQNLISFTRHQKHIQMCYLWLTNTNLIILLKTILMKDRINGWKRGFYLGGIYLFYSWIIKKFKNVGMKHRTSGDLRLFCHSKLNG